MTEVIGLLIGGLFIGCYGTLVGIGGGPLIVPLIALNYNYPTPTVVAISLFAIFFNTLSGTIAYYRDRKIDIVSGTKFGLATIPGSLISVFAVYYIHLHVFTFLFGIFLLILSIYIFIKPVEYEKNQESIGIIDGKDLTKKNTKLRKSFSYNSVWKIRNNYPDEWEQQVGKKFVVRIIKDRMGNIYKYRVNEQLGILLTAMIGVFSTFLGIGGGLIQVPVLVYLLFFPVHIATATSHYITAINSCFTLIPFMVNGDILYRPAIILSVGVVIGAQFGAHFSKKVDGEVLLKLLIPVFIFMGIKLLLFS